MAVMCNIKIKVPAVVSPSTEDRFTLPVQGWTLTYELILRVVLSDK